MKPAVKILLYVILLAVGIACAMGVRVNLAGMERVGNDEDAGSRPPAIATNVTLTATNLSAETNDAPATNAVAAASTNLTAATSPAPTGKAGSPAPRHSLGRAVAFGGGALLCLVGLGLLIGRDVSAMMANRLDRFVFNDDLEGVTDPEYEEAENIWKAGRHLEAVQLMRDYYKRHPSEVYVALRIAEIYEADLRNYLASALEYEEILQKKLPDERWGWAAIHLANLYSGKLDKPHQATEILHRIIDDYGHTVAAKKARQRLGIPEPVEEESPAPDAPADAAPQPEVAEPPQFQVKAVGKPVRPPASESLPAPPPEPPKPSLPPGFRPKN
jgi:TolA-binding protein